MYDVVQEGRACVCVCLEDENTSTRERNSKEVPPKCQCHETSCVSESVNTLKQVQGYRGGQGRGGPGEGRRGMECRLKYRRERTGKGAKEHVC